ncbi:MAG: solute carrier family 23 protein [Atribacterota bacterium]|nr:solute carrier family 23 protein [Atribacterota bacterium]MDD4895959.1 solute carrier family 23 protein [Atribacterota bacterium]MDD5636562.1 solute carrier family 23 protein [Atribacterota bacterium]
MNLNNQQEIIDYTEKGLTQTIVLGLQHGFTMFSATILVPIITGLDVSVALFMAGIGTLIFHLVTKNRVPAFLGSSFAFITPITLVAEKYGIPYALGGIVAAGLIYLIISFLVSYFGSEKIISFFPPVVTGPVIMVIGLKLAPTAISMASENWWLALIGFIIVVINTSFARGFLKVLPVLMGIVLGYLVAILMGLIDFTPVVEAKWLGFPQFTMAHFNWNAIIIVAPVAIVTVIEHIGDVLAIGATVEKDLVKNPGLSRTLLGDGLATSVAALFGGPANTTYSENTGVLALTKVYNPVVMRIAALFAILIGLIPKLGALIATIPGSLIGGISIILFGMIAAVGVRTVVENRVNFEKPRNLIIAATILVISLGGVSIPISLANGQITVEGMALGALVGIILNKVMPE